MFRIFLYRKGGFKLRKRETNGDSLFILDSINCTSSRVRNHKGAREHPEAIENYLSSEINRCSVLGTFQRNPFVTSDIIVSPLNTVPKKDSDERRVILDLSYLKGLLIE